MIYIKKLFSYSYSMQNASTRSILAMFLISLVFSFSTFFIALGSRAALTANESAQSSQNQIQFNVKFKILDPSAAPAESRSAADIKQSGEKSLQKKVFYNFLQRFINSLIR